MTAWTADGKIAEVVDKTTPTGQAYHQREFAYWGSASTVGRRGHIQSVTLSEFDGTTWTNVRQMSYDYYVAGDSYGLPGDLKTVVTQQWNGSSVHGRRHLLFPLQHGHRCDPCRPRVGAGRAAQRLCRALHRHRRRSPERHGSHIANYTCFYYEYDADRRVTKKIVFGGSNESDVANTLNTNSNYSDGYNNWKRKSVETRLDGTPTPSTPTTSARRF